MVVSVISFIYISIIAYGVGLFVSYLFNKMFGRKEYEAITYILIGIVAISVYVEWFSIIWKIGAIAHLGMLIIAVVGYYLAQDLRDRLKHMLKIVWSWEGLFYLGFIIFISFFVSRGDFHTDTNIYHAATIRIYEEYGIIKGLANLQLHYGYNSASLAFASIFSMNWLFGTSIHTTTGFFEIICGIYAFYGLKRYSEHKSHLGDAVRFGILFYILIILVRSMSPATDFSTNMMALLLISRWCDNMEKDNSTHLYALLSVFAVFVVTMKFSACLIVLVVIYPAFVLIKNKRISDIIGYFLLGCFVLTPFIIRNIILTGWLLYPFSGIDIFSMRWKVPKPYLEHDAAQITVWGRCLFDVDLLDMPMKEWIRYWLDYKDRHELMLLYGVVLGLLMNTLYLIKVYIKKYTYKWEYASLLLGIVGCLLVWFIQAPFIRYGLAFILAIILLPVGLFLSEEHKGLWGMITGIWILGLVSCITWYYNNYILDMGVFIEQRIRDPYYIVQKAYDDGPTGTTEINGNTIYYCTEGELNSYYYFPNTCYPAMLERSTLMGDSIESGFMAK